MSLFDIATLRAKLRNLEPQLNDPDLWSDGSKAQALLKEKKALESKIKLYEGLENQVSELPQLVEMAIELEDEEEVDRMYREYLAVEADLERLMIQTLLSGPYDGNNAILSIHAGTGGVDAMDWASMLMRMYLRWADKKDYKTKVIDLQEDDVAGIKSATIIVEGENAYGYLKAEAGVHRLVRISPFNSAGKRQTSFAAVEVMPEVDQLEEVEINNDDLRIDTFRSSGAGGQHVNTTDSAIRITHIPTNIVVSCQNERSQHQNKEMAMKLLMSKLIELKEREHKESLNELKGDYSMNTWGSQIRSYVFQPYTMVKDHRTMAEVGNVEAVMDGELDYFINEKLKMKGE